MREFNAKSSYTDDGIVGKPTEGWGGDPGDDADLSMEKEMVHGK